MKFNAISTHAPHTRRDMGQPAEMDGQPHFYSRASYEARPITWVSMSVLYIFLLTRLIRGATKTHGFDGVPAVISTHAPHTRRDPTGRG